ncbi:hypothetical protein ACUV84_032299 [Puccinellia chinampoensis]
MFHKDIGELHGQSGIAHLALFYALHMRLPRPVVWHQHRQRRPRLYFNGHLLAMSEDDIPYHVRVKYFPVVLDKEKMSRFGVLPKCAADAWEMVWVDVPTRRRRAVAQGVQLCKG